MDPIAMMYEESEKRLQARDLQRLHADLQHSWHLLERMRNDDPTYIHYIGQTPIHRAQKAVETALKEIDPMVKDNANNGR